MTSEIAVMNQRAVALAADSAVTLYESGKVVVRNDQQKLFQFADGLPLGVMFFGVADLMGHPWPVLLDHFRRNGKPRALPRCRDHGTAFLNAFDNLEAYFPRSRHRDEYMRLLGSVCRFVFRLSHQLGEMDGKRTDTENLRQAIELVWQRYQTRDDGSPRRDLDCFPPGFAEVVERDYGTAIEELIAHGFSHFTLDTAAKRRLHDIGVFCVVKDLFLEEVTGVVIGGYGTDEPYPSVVTYNVSAVVGGFLKRAEIDVTTTGSELKSAINLFADSAVTYGFLRGIELDLESRIYGTVYGLGHMLVDQLVNSFANVDPAQRESVRRQFQQRHVPEYIRRLHATMSEYQQETYIEPILRVLEIASRGELADTARELVALNIFKKRITAQRQTVGGEIDVAVVSRDAGFAWVQKQGRVHEPVS